MGEVLRYDKDAERLMQAVQDIALARDVGTLTDVVKRATRALSGADGVTFVLRENGNCYYVDEDAISPLWKGRRFPIETCISGWSMTHNEVVIIEDIYKDARIPHDAYRPTFVQSLAMIPVRSRDPIAAIGAYWAQTHRATQREFEMLQSLADAAAVSLENVQLIDALQAQVQESARLLAQTKAEISKREEVEQQFRQAQKMEAIGRLAGGVAHDFNNILTAILSFGNFVLDALQEQDPAYQDMQEVLKAGRKAEALTRQLLAFSRRQPVSPRVVNLNSVVSEMDRMLRRIVGEDVNFSASLSPDLWNVRLDPSSFEQVVVNLAVNARDAMPSGGKLTIETHNVQLEEGYGQARGITVPSGDYVVLAMSDDGEGMDADTQGQIFEPFFTTKGPGKGTGLGLSTCYGIVKQAGGFIWVYSEPGEGTTFKIYVPRVVGPADQSEQRPAVSELRGSETVLLAEDDEQVRKLTVRVLTRLGYHVVEASNGAEALLKCEQLDSEIALLLTDVVMPEMSGKELAVRLLELRPNTRVLYMSGYTADAIAHRGVLDPDVHLLSKPFTTDALARAVRAILDE